MDGWLRIAQDILLPRVCLLCGARTGLQLPLCLPCLAEMPWPGPSCYRCGVALPIDGLCPRCQKRPPPFERTLVAAEYASPVRELVHGLKFHGRMAVAELLGGLLAQGVARRPDTVPQLVIPVPLHPRRLRARGYNQAAEIARAAARQLKLSVDVESCRRIRDTLPQSRLPNVAQRARNLQGAFLLRRPLSVRHVAIVDDVMTTGSTVGEMARTLVRGGVGRIEVWACCRATPPGQSVQPGARPVKPEDPEV